MVYFISTVLNPQVTALATVAVYWASLALLVATVATVYTTLWKVWTVGRVGIGIVHVPLRWIEAHPRPLVLGVLMVGVGEVGVVLYCPLKVIIAVLLVSVVEVEGPTKCTCQMQKETKTVWSVLAIVLVLAMDFALFGKS
jgi:hypothetical protein